MIQTLAYSSAAGLELDASIVWSLVKVSGFHNSANSDVDYRRVFNVLV